MTKAELVDYVSDHTDIMKKEAKIVVDAVLAGIQQGMVADGKVTLKDFGNFITVRRNARKARNPRTGAEVHVAARKLPTFKPSEKLKRAVS